MKLYKRQTISQRLVLAEEILSIAQQDPEICARLEDYGYQKSRFADGYRRWELASSKETDQRSRLGAQVSATHSVNALFAALQMQFRTDRKLARSALRTSPALSEELRLHISTDKSREGFIRQAVHFYREVVTHPEIMHALQNEYNLTERVFIARQEKLQAFITARRVQLYMKGKTLVAVQQRRIAMKELDQFIVELIDIAKIAFMNDRQQLSKLGL